MGGFALCGTTDPTWRASLRSARPPHHRLAALTIVASVALAGCAPAIPPQQLDTDPPDPPPLAAETTALRRQFQDAVPQATFLGADHEMAMLAQAKAVLTNRAAQVERPQLLVVVDRNPAAQDLALVLAQPDGDWAVVGTTKVSTGQRGRFDHYITPTGVFFHTDAILGYRAEGTYNENGIRGLGLRGMRVWDFGWQNAMKGWKKDGERGDIRLLMHATDPALLEPRLGRPASKGCVRVPATLNRFLDINGILDVDYERAALTDARFRGLLRPERTPSPFAGNMMVVIDSRDGL